MRGGTPRQDFVCDCRQDLAEKLPPRDPPSERVCRCSGCLSSADDDVGMWMGAVVMKEKSVEERRCPAWSPDFPTLDYVALPVSALRFLLALQNVRDDACCHCLLAACPVLLLTMSRPSGEEKRCAQPQVRPSTSADKLRCPRPPLELQPGGPKPATDRISHANERSGMIERARTRSKSISRLVCLLARGPVVPALHLPPRLAFRRRRCSLSAPRRSWHAVQAAAVTTC